MSSVSQEKEAVNWSSLIQNFLLVISIWLMVCYFSFEDTLGIMCIIIFLLLYC